MSEKTSQTISYNNNLFHQDFITTITFFIAIIYVSVIYIVLGIFVSYQLDNYVFADIEKDFNVENINNVPIYQLIFNIILTFVVISLCAYILRNLVQIIPFIFNFANIDYYSIREVYTGAIIIVIMISFSQTLNKQYKDLKYKLYGKIY
jgi:hypothetical protein